MAEETEQVVEQQVEQTVETEPVVEQPDGPKPTQDPLEIARRIELGKRKAAEKRAEDAERRAIAAEERAKVISEQQQQAKSQEKIYTPEEVQEFIDKQQLKPAIGAAYLARIEAQKVYAEYEKRQKENEPLLQARQSISEYVKYIPELSDSSSEQFQKAAREFDELVNQGFPSDDRTRRAAIRMAHGDLDTLRKKMEMQTLSRTPARLPSDSSGNGGGAVNKNDISKAPDHLVAYWNKSGLSQKDREANFKYWQERQAAKK